MRATYPTYYHLSPWINKLLYWRFGVCNLFSRVIHIFQDSLLSILRSLVKFNMQMLWALILLKTTWTVTAVMINPYIVLFVISVFSSIVRPRCSNGEILHDGQEMEMNKHIKPRDLITQPTKDISPNLNVWEKWKVVVWSVQWLLQRHDKTFMQCGNIGCKNFAVVYS